MKAASAPTYEFAEGRSRLWQAILLVHAFAAVAWWWLMPHGFPVDNPHFWSNTILPLAVLLTSAIGCYGVEKRIAKIAGPIVLVVPVGWTVAVIVARLIFPVSLGRFTLPLAGVLAALWLSYLCRSPTRRPKGLVFATTVALAICAGVAAPWTQRSLDASTMPFNTSFSEESFDNISPSHPALISLLDDVRVLIADGEVTVKCGRLTIDVAPLLSFESRSPDRCWTILAPPNQRGSARRKLNGQRLMAREASLSYGGDARHTLTVRLDDDRANGNPLLCSLETFTQLDAPVFSHLNAFATVSVRGHRKLALAFSPCPEVVVDVEPADYPVGSPSRFAYLDAAGVFRVVEASSGEKGPFRELGRGQLDRREALGISLFDDGQLAATINFEDWASQASVDLSPTAGWGVPMNAIEFLRFGDAANDPAEIWLTLAGTSVGRGWDSVGHRAGAYRNRMRIEHGEPEPVRAGSD